MSAAIPTDERLDVRLITPTLQDTLPKFQKHKIAHISLTVRDRAISSKFSTPRVHLQDTLPKFQKTFGFRKMAAILNFRIFGKNTKLLISP